MSSFHLSLGVPALQPSVAFFTQLLGATVTHADESYVNLDLAGIQLTLKRTAAPVTAVPDLHIGINLDVPGFHALCERVRAKAPDRIEKAAHVVDAGTPLERQKMYLRCPAGYLVEIKGR